MYPRTLEPSNPGTRFYLHGRIYMKRLLKDIFIGLLWCILIVLLILFATGKELPFIYTDF